MEGKARTGRQGHDLRQLDRGGEGSYHSAHSDHMGLRDDVPSHSWNSVAPEPRLQRTGAQRHRRRRFSTASRRTEAENPVSREPGFRSRYSWKPWCGRRTEPPLVAQLAPQASVYRSHNDRTAQRKALSLQAGVVYQTLP